jgi:hypothetical protein
MQNQWLLRISEKYKQTEATDDFVSWSQIKKTVEAKQLKGCFSFSF